MDTIMDLVGELFELLFTNWRVTLIILALLIIGVGLYFYFN